MAYTAKTWATNEVITSTALNHIEDGIQDVSDGVIATVHQTAPLQSISLEMGASDTLRASDDTEEPATGVTYAKIKELAIPKYYTRARSIRVKFDLSGDENYSVTTYGKIYINGVAAGVEKSNTVSAYQTFSEDFSTLTPGDTIELWLKADYSNIIYLPRATCRNFRIYADDTIYSGDKDAAW